MTTAVHDTDVHVPFAHYSDASTAALPVVEQGLIRNGIVVGCAASGTTALLDTTATNARAEGIDVMFFDQWNAKEHLAELQHWLRLRMLELDAGRVDPQQHDLLLVLIDDANMVFNMPLGDDRSFGQHLEADLRFARKVNVAFLAAVPDPSLASFGESLMVRDSLASTVLLMRHLGGTLGRLPHYDGQPASDLPPAGGQGYTLTGDRPHELWQVSR